MDALGGSATFFARLLRCTAACSWWAWSAATSRMEELAFLEERGVDLAGLDRCEGESFRWSGVYSYDLNSRETLETRLGVFADFQPKIPESFRDAEWIFLGNIDPVLQLDVLEQVRGRAWSRATP
jgi:hypothetical protein